MNTQYEQKKGIDWLEVTYSLILVAVVAGFFYWAWYSHKNSPCYKDPIPAEYRTQCLYGYK